MFTLERGESEPNLVNRDTLLLGRGQSEPNLFNRTPNPCLGSVQPTQSTYCPLMQAIMCLRVFKQLFTFYWLALSVLLMLLDQRHVIIQFKCLTVFRRERMYLWVLVAQLG